MKQEIRYRVGFAEDVIAASSAEDFAKELKDMVEMAKEGAMRIAQRFGVTNYTMSISPWERSTEKTGGYGCVVTLDYETEDQ